MHQIAFYIGSKPVNWYGVCIAVGFLLATGILLWKRNHAKMSSDQIFDLSMIALFAGILGARAFYVIEFWDTHFAGRPFLEIFRIDHGGLVFYGGFLLAIVTICLYAWRKKLYIPAMLDIAAPAIAIGHAFGRIGCFMQGCCFGSPAKSSCLFPVRFPFGTEPYRRYPALDGLHSLALYPVQLYESFLNILLCAGLLLLFKKVRHYGQIAGIYLIGYAAIRFSLEFFRGDHTDSFLGLTPSQNIALFLMLPLGIALFWYQSKNNKARIFAPESVSVEKEEEKDAHTES